MGFDITPPKKRPVAKPPQQPTQVVSSPSPKQTQSVPKQTKTKPPKVTKQKRKKKFGKFIFFLVVFVVVAGIVYAVKTGYITLPEKSDNPTRTDDTTIITTFPSPILTPDDEIVPEGDGVDVVNDPLMSAHLDFVGMIESLPKIPAPAGYDQREVQLLHSYTDDF